jgi:hypothetical protein
VLIELTPIQPNRERSAGGGPCAAPYALVGTTLPLIILSNSIGSMPNLAPSF